MDVAIDLWLFGILFVITSKILGYYWNWKHILEILSIFDYHATLNPDITCCSKLSTLMLL